MDKNNYKSYTKSHAKKSPTLKNCLYAFLIGGFICDIGQFIFNKLEDIGLDKETSLCIVPICLVFLSCLLTGFGLYDRLAKRAGAGTLVPITGFANAVCSPAIDNKAEGYILGMGAKMFVVAGPVIVFGTLFSVLLGIIFYILKRFGIDATYFIIGG